MKQFTYTITDPVGIHARPARAGGLSFPTCDFGWIFSHFRGRMAIKSI